MHSKKIRTSKNLDKESKRNPALIQRSGIFLFKSKVPREMGKKKKVAIQGIAGCFHDCAARLFFQDEEIELEPCESFPVLFEKVREDSEMLAIVAIENTIAGSLLQNYELIRNSGLSIVGEHKLRIRQSLCALPGQRLETLDEVLSHPIALLQCGEYLRRHPQLRIIEFDDTANAAKTIAEKR